MEISLCRDAVISLPPSRSLLMISRCVFLLSSSSFSKPRGGEDACSPCLLYVCVSLPKARANEDIGGKYFFPLPIFSACPYQKAD